MQSRVFSCTSSDCDFGGDQLFVHMKSVEGIKLTSFDVSVFESN